MGEENKSHQGQTGGQYNGASSMGSAQPQHTTNGRHAIDPNFDATLDAALTPADLLAAEREQAANVFRGQWQHWTAGRDNYAPVRYLVDGLIEANNIGLWFGGAGIGKTLLLQNLAACLATGQTWLANSEGLPEFEINASAGVLWIDYDNGKRTTGIRMAAAMAGMKAGAQAQLYWMSETIPWLELDKADHILSLVATIKKLQGVKIVFIDALGLVTGDVDENSPDMSKVMRNVKTLRDFTGCAIHLIHHPNKGSRNEESHLFNAAGNAKITNFAEFAVEMREGGEAGQIVCQIVKRRNYVAAHQFAAQLTYTHKDDSFDLDTFKFDAAKVTTMAQRKSDIAQESIVKVLKKHSGLAKYTLIDMAKEIADEAAGEAVGQAILRKAVNEMIDDGRITTAAGERNATLCILTARMDEMIASGEIKVKKTELDY